MWLYVLKTKQGDEPFVLDEPEAPPEAPGVWSRITEVRDIDEAYEFLGRHRAEPTLAR